MTKFCDCRTDNGDNGDFFLQAMSCEDLCFSELDWIYTIDMHHVDRQVLEIQRLIVGVCTFASWITRSFQPVIKKVIIPRPLATQGPPSRHFKCHFWDEFHCWILRTFSIPATCGVLDMSDPRFGMLYRWSENGTEYLRIPRLGHSCSFLYYLGATAQGMGEKKKRIDTQAWDSGRSGSITKKGL